MDEEMCKQATGLYLNIKDTRDVHVFDFVRDFKDFEVTDPFSLKNQLVIMVPVDEQTPWIFGIHQCAKYKEWVKADIDLFREISRRLLDAIHRHLYYRDLALAKEKAEESDRLKTAFLANMSHEIRTPMNGILGFADLLKDTSLSQYEQQRYLTLIQRSGERMLLLINNLMDISKIESGQVDVYLIKTDIKEQLEFLDAFFQTEAKAKGLTLSVNCNIPEKDIIVKTDGDKLFAILSNLVKNAIKFTKNGSVTVNCDNTDNGLAFSVSDTGIGIAEDRQSAIFERFIQADLEDREVYEGAGLGLSISKAFVELLGGNISVDSRPGEGAVFHFTIECEFVDGGMPKNKEISKAIDLSELKNVKILLVEDDEMSEKYIIDILKKYVNTIDVARNGLDAVKMCFENTDYNVILLDVKLPKLNGIEAAKKIRTMNNDVVIIAQTAFTDKAYKKDALNAGCNEFILKPIKDIELRELILKYNGGL